MKSCRRADAALVALLRRSVRPLGLALLVALAAALLLACSPRQALAEVAEVGTKTVGIQPRSTELTDTVSADGFENSDGHAVVGSSRVYAVYWDPDNEYHGNWQELINEFFANMSSASGSTDENLAVDSQYTDAAGVHAGSETIFAGAYTDTDGYPALEGCSDPDPLTIGAITCLSGEQIESELETFIKDHSLPTGMNAIYYVLTPPGVTDCLADSQGQRCSDYSSAAGSYRQSFCSYHAAINPGGSPEGSAETILFAAIPWSAGGLGDYHLTEADQVNASECQDGGWEPSAPESKYVEAKEGSPVEQEPNQSGLGPDGSYDAGLADLIINQIAVEQQDIVTNPLMGSWRTTGTQGAPGNEILGQEVTDLCRDFFAPALSGGSGAETVEEAEERAAHLAEAEQKLAEEHLEWSSTEVKKEAEKQVGAPSDGEEDTDAGTLYNAELGEGHYYLNDTFDLAGAEVAYPGVTCLTGVSLVPNFTPPTKAKSGEIIGFDGMESDITLNQGTTYEGGVAKPTYPVYEWNFGDGTPVVKGYAPGASSGNPPETSLCEAPWLKPCAGAVFHSYTYGGTYEVTLTVTDVAGHAATVTKSIYVAGPAPPSTGGSGATGGAPEGGGSGQAQTQAQGSNSSGSGSTSAKSGGKASKSGKSGKSGKAATLASPKLTAVVQTRTTAALTKGLKVSYSVNEQAAGRFEVLLATKLAKRLGVSGVSASGLPKGAKPETVIARALLVTTRRAKRTIAIAIPKRSAQRLARLSSLTLTLRLSARDASTSDPQVSILSTVAKLTH
jgi:hypothetical protein